MSTTTAAAAEPPLKTYRGNCHCGAFVYEVEAPEITSAGDCNCSICYKRGYLWLVPKKPLTVVKDEGKLVGYSFGSKALDHQVCYYMYLACSSSSCLGVGGGWVLCVWVVGWLTCWVVLWRMWDDGAGEERDVSRRGGD